MSVWKSNFFLQTGLQASLPKPPVRDPAPDVQFAAENRLPRRFPRRCKDTKPRKKRPPLLFNFYESMRVYELRETDANALLSIDQARDEFRAHTQHQRAFWDYMLELYIVFEQQELVVDPSLGDKNAYARKRELRRKFYHLKEPAQQQLVRDHIADRWEREHYAHVQEKCHQENLRYLVDIRRDLRLLLGKVERALNPRDEPVPDRLEDEDECQDEEPVHEAMQDSPDADESQDEEPADEGMEDAHSDSPDAHPASHDGDATRAANSTVSS